MYLKTTISTIILAVAIFSAAHVQAQDKARYEYAVVKWDGTDRLLYNLPDKFELVQLAKAGIKIPKEAHEEEYCLAVAANQMAKEGWEPVNLNSRRILFRRQKPKK